MILIGEQCFRTASALEMANEMYINVEKGLVEGSSDGLAKENHHDFITKVSVFVVRG